MHSISILFHRFGPYHHARLEATAKLCNLTAIEFCEMDETYQWDKINNTSKFQQLSLFNDVDSKTQEPDEIRRRIHKILTKANPQVVVIPGWADKCSLAALLWCVNKRIPAIVMSESQAIDEPRKWLKEKIKAQLIRLFSSGLVGGKPHKDYLVALGMNRNRIFTGYDAIDNTYFSKNAMTARQHASAIRAQNKLPRHYFLASSRFIEKKNLFYLLRAYASYRERAGCGYWKLVLLGDGHPKNELLKLRGELGLSDDVLLPGFKQYSELPSYYALAEAFIHASTTEQWGLVVNEAMASGLPVLVSERCGCAQDLVSYGKNGFTFNPHESEELTRLMLMIYAGEYEIADMGRASQGIVTQWDTENFAMNLMRAVDVATTNPVPRAGIVDKTILYSLMTQ